ncbi:helix-turn-helix domain-containing protein [Algoriphagus hitonicola]|uniref:Helix-turn-helix domain-containing protein n=1 Tax=Algoriphagus hitonicola TaxID=435880 RepID=A0A1I2TKE2_9BACT|nr:helix-turn-helix domain-containing protein [Algoriphagus hitonicola]SFG65310.1 Helix-turn-helix domain-containing protein [Algoriphagus hitonicola]
MNEKSTDRIDLAAQFVNSTAAPIFLTGKAGTGKTTFLRNLSHQTHKRHVVLAPTGIAALHAKGVTIHSQFLLPLGSFLPVREPEGNFTHQYGFYTQHTLARKHPLNQLRKSVLRAVDLLVIDEVSMLRADVLDAIDYRMRSVKGNFREPFGGVQLLLIGDLYQLPPIVRDHEWQILSRFYNSMHFFEAKALQNSGLVYLELDKIFRQQDEEFIHVLNNLRNNQITAEDIRLLNRHFKSPDQIKGEKDCITITTHNYKADQINQKELQSLDGKSFFYQAEVEGDFPESLYPLPEKLELREGAQVMFIKNDTSGTAQYFNGKLAKVVELNNDEVTVQMEGDEQTFLLRKEVWENKRYVVNPETKELDEDVIGTFSHFPIKLAWAVTVHKSQGLTFDKAIIDVGQAFAPGQVYVALSRLRSLDGLILRSRIQSDLIYSDHQVVKFSQSSDQQQRLDELLKIHQRHFLQQLIDRTFDFIPIIKEIEYFQKNQESSMEFEDIEMQAAIPIVYENLRAETENTGKFRRQLQSLLQIESPDQLSERLQKGVDYYKGILKKLLGKIIDQRAMVSNFSRTKKYQDGLESIDELIVRKLLEINKINNLIQVISKGEVPGKMDELEMEILGLRRNLMGNAKEKAMDKIKNIKTKTGRKKAEGPKLKRQKGDTQELTFSLFESGKTIAQIAEERGLAESTIKSHLSVGISAGRIDLADCLPQSIIQEIMDQLDKFSGMKELREHFDGKYDYGTIKMVIAGNKNL